MKQFYLAEIITKDKFVHQGIFYKPSRSGKKAILWVHGLGSTFYAHRELFETLADASGKLGVGFAAFNNRGHDGITGLKKLDPTSERGYSRLTGGGGVEVFEECNYDIDAGIDFLVRQGFQHVVVAGHSTGANKACYYGARTENAHVAGVILLSPMSDRLNPAGKPPWWALPLAKLLVVIGKGDMLIPVSHFPGTPKRLLGLVSAGSHEDIYDYGDEVPKMRSFSSIIKPLLVIFAEKDELADRPVAAIQAVFDRFARSRRYRSAIIPNAFHGFNGHEHELVRAITDWMRKI